MNGLVLGDSHASMYKHMQGLTVAAVAGATLAGILNPNSESKAHNLFKTYVESEAPWVLISLGEVDVGAKCWYDHDTLEDAKAYLLRRSLPNFRTFLSWWSMPVVIQSTIPTPNTQTYPELSAGIRSKVSYAMRCASYDWLNDQLQNLCGEVGATWFDLREIVCVAGELRPDIRRPGGDLHLVYEVAARLVEPRLRELVDGLK